MAIYVISLHNPKYAIVVPLQNCEFNSLHPHFEIISAFTFNKKQVIDHQTKQERDRYLQHKRFTKSFPNNHILSRIKNVVY